MAIEFTCKTCATTLRVAEEHAGKQARCPQCQNLNIVAADPVQVVSSSTGQYATNPYATNPDAKPVPQYEPGIKYTDSSSHGYKTAHRGGLVLAMGVMSMMCNFAFVPGIMAWVLGKADLAQMRRGNMDSSGQGLTQAGMIIGIVMTCLQAGAIVLYVAFVIVMILFGIIAG